jgi:hypothetical protein
MRPLGAIRITSSGTQSTLSPDDVAILRAEFEAVHCIRLPRLLTPGLLAALLPRLARATFEERVHEGIGSNRELAMTDGALSGVLHVLTNGRPLFEVIERVSGHAGIGSFLGRVYRVVPGHGHHDAWHDDLVSGRLVAMSINLGSEPFEGGVLQIRERASGRVLNEIANVEPGDALVFRLSPGLQHRISEIEGRVAKTAFAGWFVAEPWFAAALARKLRTGS